MNGGAANGAIINKMVDEMGSCVRCAWIENTTIRAFVCGSHPVEWRSSMQKKINLEQWKTILGRPIFLHGKLEGKQRKGERERAHGVNYGPQCQCMARTENNCYGIIVCFEQRKLIVICWHLIVFYD